MEKVGDPAKRSDHRYTYGEYCTWGDDERWEIIDGVAWDMSPAPNTDHQRISLAIASRFERFLQGKACEAFAAPFDVVLPDVPDQREEESPTVVQPDISVICDPSKITEAGCTGAPDLVVEILSPTTSRKDMVVKRDLYERHGVREYWIVDPGNRYILAYAVDERGAYPDDPVLYAIGAKPGRPLLESSVLPGFTLDLREVFAG